MLASLSLVPGYISESLKDCLMSVFQVGYNYLRQSLSSFSNTSLLSTKFSEEC